MKNRMVLDTLEKMEGERTCFRLVGGVLVQRQVAQVLPALQQNMDGIVNIMKQLALNYKSKEDELLAHQKKYNIKVRS